MSPTQYKIEKNRKKKRSKYESKGFDDECKEKQVFCRYLIMYRNDKSTINRVNTLPARSVNKRSFDYRYKNTNKLVKDI